MYFSFFDFEPMWIFSEELTHIPQKGIIEARVPAGMGYVGFKEGIVLCFGYWGGSVRLEMLSPLRLPTPPIKTPDPPSHTPGASKQVVLTPHDIPFGVLGPYKVWS